MRPKPPVYLLQQTGVFGPRQVGDRIESDDHIERRCREIDRGDGAVGEIRERSIAAGQRDPSSRAVDAQHVMTKRHQMLRYRNTRTAT
jgi:hypothetical protein